MQRGAAEPRGLHAVLERLLETASDRHATGAAKPPRKADDCRLNPET